MKKIIIISVLALLPLVSFAAINIEKRSDGAILETSRNAYQAGGTVGIFESKPGDVFAAGGTISVTAEVGGDVFAAGGNLSFISRVGGDLRAAGGTVSIVGPVNGDLLAAGGQIDVIPSSSIGGDFLIAGGAVNIRGTMNGNGRISAEDVIISGTLNEDVNIRAKRLTVEGTAVINGNINYKGVEEPIVSEEAQVNGKIDFSKVEEKAVKAIGWGAFFGILGLAKLLMILVAALVLFFMMKPAVVSTSNRAADNFWKELLRGFVLLIAIPVLAIILFISVIGVFIALPLIALYAFLAVLGSIFSVIVAAQILNRMIFKGDRSRKLNWPMIILGTAVLGLLSIIPFIGWIISLVFFLVGFGAVSGSLYRQARMMREQ